MPKRALLVLSVALTTMVLLAGACGTTPADSGSDEPTIDASAEVEPSAAEASDEAAPSALAGTLRLYTSVSQEPVDAVLEAYAAAAPDVDLELFRAPTGELNARLAAERREGGPTADVLWLSDPLSMQTYADEGLLAALPPGAAPEVPAGFRTDVSFGTHYLEVVAVQQPGLEPPVTSWRDLADPTLADAVAIPDPTFAGSAFGALGWFAQSEEYGLDFFRDLEANGAVQLSAPGEVLTGVAEGRFRAGITIGFSAEQAIADGAPVEIVRPESGAIAVYSPIAVLEASDAPDLAADFLAFLAGPEAQELLVEVGQYEAISGAADQGPDAPVAPDWTALAAEREELTEEYRAIFGA